MPDNVYKAIAECRNQSERIAEHVECAEGSEVGFVARIPARGAAETALIRRDSVITGFGEPHHHLAPAIGEFGKAVEEQDAGAVRRFESGFQHVNFQPVDVVEESRAN